MKSLIYQGKLGTGRLNEARGAARAAKLAEARAELAAAASLAAAGAFGPVPMARRRKVSHYVDLASATYACDTTGTITLVATIAQGASQQQRIGKRAQYRSFQIRGYAYNGSTATINDCAVLLVYDRRPTGALPAITDILNTANSRSFNNDVNSSRFKILMRRDFMLEGAPATTLGDGGATNFDEFVKCNLPIQFAAVGTGAIGDLEVGAVYLITVGMTAAGTAAANLVCGIRTRFIDVEG